MNKILIVSGTWILLTVIFLVLAHDRGKEDFSECLAASLVISTPITMIFLGIIW